MKQFEEKKFTIGPLVGISAKTIEEHLKLYAGYVKHTNLVLQKVAEMSAGNPEDNAFTLLALNRRLPFEYNGIRNHEIYFDLLSDGARALNESSSLAKQLESDFGSYDAWLSQFKTIATTRGIGWAILYWDKKEGRLLNAWIDEQHMGQLQGCTPIIALDMWEHSFVADYQPSGKKQYIEDFFANINWQKAEQNFTA